MVENFTFASPWVLLLILLFMLLDYLHHSQKEGYYMPNTSWFKSSNSPKTLWQKWLKWAMIISAIMALANPIVYKESQSIKPNAIDIVLALDTSGSMSMYGFNPKAYQQTRLDAVKEVVSDFIAQRKNDRIGLVVFGTYSSIASPLSFDKKAQSTFVQGLQIGALGKSTALIDALVSSVQLLKESQAKSKIVILLSDGEDSSSKAPLPIALKFAKKYGIKIYTIIIDTTHSNIMKLIAKANHTKAYNPKNQKALQEVYANINRLEKSTLYTQTLKTPHPLYGYFLTIALVSGFILLSRHKIKEIF